MSVTPLRRIGPQDGDDYRTRIEQMMEAHREQYGISPLADCVWCDDTGINPASNLPCVCAAGVALDRNQYASSQWGTRVPSNLQGYTLKGHPTLMLASLVNNWLADKPVETGTNLVIIGAVGVGKTGAAIGALRELHHTSRPIPNPAARHADEIETRNYSVRYWNSVSLMDRFREEIGQSNRKLVSGEVLLTPIRPELSNCDCLLLDDVATERPSEWVYERLYALINDRYTKGLPTIFTSNHKTTAEFERYLGERMADRVMERCTVIVCDKSWPNLRRTK